MKIPFYTKFPIPPVAFKQNSDLSEPVPFIPITIQENHTVRPPSDSNDGFTAAGYFSIPFAADGSPLAAVCRVKLEVDDWGVLEILNAAGDVVLRADLSADEQLAGAQGGHTIHAVYVSCNLVSGDYSFRVVQENIDYDPPSDNQSVCNYSINIVPLEAGGQQEPEPNPCIQNNCDNYLGGVPATGDIRNGMSTLNSTSAGCTVLAETTESLMYWACNFGTFRNLGNIPVGRIELREETNITRLSTPLALAYNHPLNTYLRVPEGGLVPDTKCELVQGDRVIVMRCYPDGSVAPIGVDTFGGGRASLVTVDNQTCLRWVVDDGSRYLFNAIDGTLISFTAPDGQILVNDGTYLDIKRNADGPIRQIWNLWDGLLDIEPIAENEYRISLYTPAQVGELDSAGYYTVSGAPIKTFTCTFANNRFSITEQAPQRQAYVVTWWQDGLTWNIGKGTGEDTIHTLRQRTELEPGVWQVVTAISKNEQVAARTCDIYQTTPLGNLQLTHVDGYGGERELTTQNIFDGTGQVQTTIAPDGSKTFYEYDFYGRLVTQDEPWANAGRKITRLTYEHSGDSDFSTDLASNTVHILPLEGHIATLKQEQYNYRIADHIKRTEIRTTGLGVTGERLTISEEWLASAPDIYSRGRIRMQQGIDGIQSWHEYLPTSDYGALYTEVITRKVDGELVPGNSTREIRWITAEGQIVRTESQILCSDNHWALTDSDDIEYDIHNRWVKRTHANGRVEQRELICTGDILWAIDADGIRTDNAYDTARQLIETTRGEVIYEGATITPETITAFTRNATGQVIEQRTFTGPMATVETTAYDLLQREISQTDILGRTTVTDYSTDGLVTTQIDPAGATFISRFASDGSILERSGSGQQELLYDYALMPNGIRTTTKTVVNGQEVILSRNIENGVGETIVLEEANTQGGFITTTQTYNEKGLLIRMQTGSLAPTIREYDDFNNQIQETIQLATPATIANSPITTWEHSVAEHDNGVYKKVVTTKNNGQGTTYSQSLETLISKTSSQIEQQTLITDPRGNITTRQTQYGPGACRFVVEITPTSNVSALSTVVDNFTLSQRDTANVTTSSTRAWTANGLVYTNTDARGNVTTIYTDIADRTILVRDAAGYETSTEYSPVSDNVVPTVNPKGETTYSLYDIRGREVATFGTAVTPVVKSYDDANNLISITTFRVDDETISTDPTTRTDGDTTRWAYDPATNLEIEKTYPDGTSVFKTYDNMNNLATVTNARGIIQTRSYAPLTGLLTAIAFSDNTPGQQISYNVIGQPITITDAGGAYHLSYNQYAEALACRLRINSTDFTLQELYDNFGRSTGFELKRGDTVFHTNTYAYNELNELFQAAFLHRGSEKVFTFERMAGTHLLERLISPNNMTRTYGYEAQRDLITSIIDKRSTANVVERYYTYNELVLLTHRRYLRERTTRNDTFEYNARNELTSAILGDNPYAYNYDNIYNRKTAQELADEFDYTTNNLNQYTDIVENGAGFASEFDLDGNQIKIKTTTGIWSVRYDALNRPIRFTSDDESMVIENVFDYLGRRVMKTTTVNGAITENLRFIYRGYLQIAALDLTRSSLNDMWLLTWDPTEPQATRPLAIQINNTWYTYGIDLSKNVTELFGQHGYIVNTYTYAPYGDVIITGEVAQPIQWSSEYADSELGLIYYNYRYYNPLEGRWISRDPFDYGESFNLYLFASNQSTINIDLLGLSETQEIKCCKDGIQYKEVEDDAHRICCDYELQTISILVIPRDFLQASVGHAWVKTPNMQKGLYPDSWYKGVGFSGAGIIRDDTVNEEKANAGNSYSYKSCPESTKMVETLIEKDEKHPPSYALFNSHARNCCGWACKIVEGAGFVAPFCPNTVGLAPANRGYKGYGPGRNR